MKIEIVYYNRRETGTVEGWNTKVLYRKHGKLYLAHIYVSYFNGRVHYPKDPPREDKILKGFDEAIKKWLTENKNLTF